VVGPSCLLRIFAMRGGGAPGESLSAQCSIALAIFAPLHLILKCIHIVIVVVDILYYIWLFVLLKLLILMYKIISHILKKIVIN
jgi:hypothetical protein